MKFLVILVLVGFAAAAPSEEVEYLYKIDFDALYADDAEREATFDCILEKTPCGERQKYKDSVMKVVLNQCTDCNPDQKAKYDYVLKKFRDDYESIYNDFMKLITLKKS